jgi:hypothetical protein
MRRCGVAKTLPPRVAAAVRLWESLDYERGTLRRRRLTSSRILMLLSEMTGKEQTLYYREVHQRERAQRPPRDD